MKFAPLIVSLLCMLMVTCKVGMRKVVYIPKCIQLVLLKDSSSSYGVYFSISNELPNKFTNQRTYMEVMDLLNKDTTLVFNRVTTTITDTFIELPNTVKNIVDNGYELYVVPMKMVEIQNDHQRGEPSSLHVLLNRSNSNEGGASFGLAQFSALNLGQHKTTGSKYVITDLGFCQ